MMGIRKFLNDDRGQLGLGNILNQARGGIGQALETPSGSRGADRDMFTENRFDTWTGDSLTDGAFVELANFSVPAQTGYTWGYGEPSEGKSDNQGRIYFDPQGDTPSDTVGRLRLNSRNAVGKNRADHGTFHSSELRQTLTDRRTWPFLPERDMPIVSEDSVLYLEFEYDSSASTDSTVDQTNSTLRMNVTEFS